MAILNFKKMMSYDSHGAKKSYQLALMIMLGCGRGYNLYTL
jgi:hypothetical protein